MQTITINRKALVSNLELLKPVIDLKFKVPVLTCVEIKPQDNRVILRGTDLENFVSLSIEAQCEASQALAIPYAQLLKALKGSKVIDVTLEPLAEEKIRVTLGELTLTIQGWDASSMPGNPAIAVDAWRDQMLVSDFLHLVARTRFLASPNNARYNLNAVYLEPSKRGLCMTATDGHRLSHITGAALDLPKPLLVSVHTLDALVKLAGKLPTDSTMTIAYQDNIVRFVLPGNRVLTGRLVEGEFPDWRAVMPKDTKQTATVSGSAMMDILKAVSVCASDKHHGVKLALENHVKPACLTISAHSTENGDASQSIPATFSNVEHPDIALGFQAPYLTDFLTLAGKSDVTIGLVDEVTAGTFHSVDESDWTYIVMPIRL